MNSSIFIGQFISPSYKLAISNMLSITSAASCYKIFALIMSIMVIVSFVALDKEKKVSDVIA